MTFAAVLISLWLYRAVMGPLQVLRRGVRTIARGKFTDRLDPRGDREFQELARDFNQMAGELDDLYRELEAKVAAKSKELVRSERLASVGFLAAGVAHEINNPLGIISGYAELSMRKLRHQIASAGAADSPALPAAPAQATLKALQVICDEAFRCKQIIEKLLGLARGGLRGPDGGEAADERKPVSLTKVARDVIDLVQGLPRYRDRRVELHTNGSSADAATMVNGNETELKQVVLNLVINALEATEGRTGHVHIELHRDDKSIQLIVRDNGKGMSPQTLDRLFEPFYTDKRGGGEGEARGTGLGLSISHAIIQQHGGAIHAASEGPGKGSTLTVELPAMQSSLST
jgi:signal transduction histidine kinase